MLSEQLKIYNKSCYWLSELDNNSIDAIATDPPYWISYQNHYWDNDLPDSKIWVDCLRVLKPWWFGLVFSSVRLMHRMMVALEDSWFLIKDVIFWSYLNWMPKTRNVWLDIDKELWIDSEKIWEYKYVQWYKKWWSDSYLSWESKNKFSPASSLWKKYDWFWNWIKPVYEPIILIQKPIEKWLNVAKNIVKYWTWALNLEDTRIPYEEWENKVWHNPHPKWRVMWNLIRTDEFNDWYDKFFLVSKVRQNKDDYNFHPTLKPVDLMQHIIKLISMEWQTILDPFMWSGSTGLACIDSLRKFVWYELDDSYFEICNKRFDEYKRPIKVESLFWNSILSMNKKFQKIEYTVS